MNNVIINRVIPLGRLVITATAHEELDSTDLNSALRRHARGDWGELEAQDIEQNEWALRQGERLFSVYQDRRETRFYIITEADRSVTTVLLPEDY